MSDNTTEQQPPAGMAQAIWDRLSPETKTALLEELTAGTPRRLPSHYPHDRDDIEDVIARDDLLRKIRDHIGAGEQFNDRSLWALLDEFAQPLSLEQSAVLYALEELYGEGVIDNDDSYLVHFSLGEKRATEQQIPTGMSPEMWAGLSDEGKKFYERLYRTTVGEVHAALDKPEFTDRGLLAYTEEAKDLLYACLCHNRVNIEEVRSMMGPVSDAVWDECETYDPRPGALRSFRG